MVILTDDQRWDTLWAMPVVQGELGARGMTFANFIVENPLCCPSRATLLTGQAAHTTGVYTNHEPSGFEQFEPHEGSTLATWLHAGGYYTGLVGKYLNGYNVVDVEHLPPGWDQWYAVVENYYYNMSWSLNGKLVTFGEEPDVRTRYPCLELAPVPMRHPEPSSVFPWGSLALRTPSSGRAELDGS